MTPPILIYLWRHRAYWQNLLRLMLRWQSWPLYLSGSLLALGVYLDERVVNTMELRFWEELAETYGYGFMVLAGWRHRSLVGDPVLDASAN
jgi:hypothetical protein